MALGGWFGEDLWEGAKDVATSVVDRATDALGHVPGARELAEAAKDFANTPTGIAVLRAMSTTFYGTLAWPLGPQLASVAFALPGLFRGEPFEQAWFDEVKWRAEKTAEVLAPSAMDLFNAQLTDTLRKLGEDVGVGNLLNEGARELAARLNIREDVAAFARALWNRLELPRREDYDPASGRFNIRGAAVGALRPGAIPTQAYVRGAPVVSPAAGAVGAFRPGAIDMMAAGKWARPAASSPAPVAIAARTPTTRTERKVFGDVLLGVTVNPTLEPVRQ